MLPIFILFFLLTIALGGITTIPLSIPLIIVCAVLFRKPWVFFAAFFLGLFLDLILLRSLGQTGLFFILTVFTVFIYERKFETQTISFVLISSFLGSLAYLMVFSYQQILLQSFINSFLAVLFFKFSIRNLKFEMKI